MTRIYALFLGLACFCGASLGATVIKIGPDDSAVTTATISGEVNRISIKGTRIVRIWGNPDSPFHAEINPETSDVFIRAESQDKSVLGRTFNYYLTDKNGYTYQLGLTATDKGPENIVLDPQGAASASAPQLPRVTSQPHADASKYPARVVFLMRSMEQGVRPDDYEVVERNQPVLLWDEIDMRLVRVYSGDTFSGFTYVLRNKTNAVQRIREPEFMAPGILAVMIEAEEIAPGQSIRAWVVREGKGS